MNLRVRLPGPGYPCQCCASEEEPLPKMIMTLCLRCQRLLAHTFVGEEPQVRQLLYARRMVVAQRAAAGDGLALTA